MRLAFFTPLNPQRSGVSDYSEELLPHLSAHADVDVVVSPDFAPRAGTLPCCRVLSPSGFRTESASYDGIVYQIANSFEHHGYMLELLSAYPGVTVLHDYCLHHLALGSTALQGDLRALRRSAGGTERSRTVAKAFSVAD